MVIRVDVAGAKNQFVLVGGNLASGDETEIHAQASAIAHIILCKLGTRTANEVFELLQQFHNLTDYADKIRFMDNLKETMKLSENTRNFDE